METEIPLMVFLTIPTFSKDQTGKWFHLAKARVVVELKHRMLNSMNIVRYFQGGTISIYFIR